MRLGIRDQKVLAAFAEKRSADGDKLSTDGKRIDGHWLGGSRLAYWERGQIHTPDRGSRAADAIQKQLRRHAAPVQFADFKGLAKTRGRRDSDRTNGNKAVYKATWRDESGREGTFTVRGHDMRDAGHWARVKLHRMRQDVESNEEAWVYRVERIDPSSRRRDPERGTGLRAPDVVQLRFEPGTGGVVLRADGGGYFQVQTPGRVRRLHWTALRKARPEHAERIRRAAFGRDPESSRARAIREMKAVNRVMKSKHGTGKEWFKGVGTDSARPRVKRGSRTTYKVEADGHVLYDGMDRRSAEATFDERSYRNFEGMGDDDETVRFYQNGRLIREFGPKTHRPQYFQRDARRARRRA